VEGQDAQPVVLTYSIVARDSETGQLGAAVQSRAFACGSGVLWARPGVGVVATQSYAERSYGPLGLELLEAGKTPEQALAALVVADPDQSVRQVAILAADGSADAHTGADCIPDAGHQLGDAYSVQANIMRNTSVWPAMAEAFEAASGPLARRLLTALDAGELAGGDWRGRQAAAILVVPPEGKPWENVVDLRVDDHPEPLAELKRLLDLHDGYEALDEPGDVAGTARRLGMDELDVRFAEILDAAHAGNVGRARVLLAPLLADEPRWATYIRVLGARGYIPHADELVD
jgi:uncharacterized Ntn-hydrolase superfamily protein